LLLIFEASHKQKIQKKNREIQKYKKVLEEKQKKDKYISLEEHTRTPRKLPKIGWGGSKYTKLKILPYWQREFIF